MSGDTAIINSGTVSGTAIPFSAVVIDLNQTSSRTSSTLALASVAIQRTTFQSTTTLNVTTMLSTPIPATDNAFDYAAPTLSFTNGGASNAGTMNFTALRASVELDGILLNTGVMNFIGSTVQVTDLTGQSKLENDGTMNVVRSRGFQPASSIATPVIGQGTIEIGAYGAVSFQSSVAGTQLLRFNGGADQYEEVDFSRANAVSATIAGFSKTDLIRLASTPYTGATYTSSGANSGTLSIFNGTLQTAQLFFSGRYTLSDFTFDNRTLSGDRSELRIGTSANEAQYGALPAGYGYATRPIYRFFDQTDGTQFLTSSTSERNTVAATRPDLVQETGAFSAVAYDDAGAAPIYRFFDTRFGTHFFTASAGERDSLLSQRSDLTYEPSSTFFEHATQQAGDVAVHRFYETRTGTHFYTGSQAEYQGLTTPGGGSYRNDLVSEGVAFYAPSTPAT